MTHGPARAKIRSASTALKVSVIRPVSLHSFRKDLNGSLSTKNMGYIGYNRS